MEFIVKSGSPEKQRTACTVVGVFEPRRLSAAAKKLDEVSDGYISALLRRGDLEGKAGQTLLLHNVPNTLSDRILLVGCGKEREFGDRQFRDAMGTAAQFLNEKGAMESVCYITEEPARGRDIPWNVRAAVESVRQALYRFDRFLSDKDRSRRPLRKLVLCVPSRKDLADSEQALVYGQALSNGGELAKDLANLPSNVCTPTYLAEQAQKLAKGSRRVKVNVLGETEMKKMGMGALLAVARGSREPAKLITVQYNNGGKDQRPVALVGKGVTFDSGGISIKPSASMDEMKYDMSGAASVLGTLKAAIELKLPLNVIGVIPATENLPDGNATKPGDIVTSLSGQTIEILNTDAEGRLILCDALTYCERFNPDVVIDIATLTGACVIALGQHASGLLSNYGSLAKHLVQAGKFTGDRVWELPLWEDYQPQLKSNFADMANIGGREAGTITAACFLSRFTKKYHWAHIDIAGTAWNTGDKKGATGRPVPLLTQYLIERCSSGT